MAEQMPIPATPPMQGPAQAAPEVPTNPIIQVGTGENQIPVDLSAFQDGQQVNVMLTCNVKASTTPSPENGQQGEVAAPSMSLEVMSAEATPAKSDKDVARSLSGPERENALDDELDKIQ